MSRNNDFNPLRRLMSVVFTLLVITIMLWLAVQLITAIWPVLLIITLIVAVLVVVVFWLRRRQNRW